MIRLLRAVLVLAGVCLSTSVAAPAEELPLSLAEALRLALEHNPSLEVARYGPRLADTALPEAQAAFDPRLEASTLWQDSVNQLSAVQQFTFQPDGGDEPVEQVPDLELRGLALSSALSTRFTTGAELELGLQLDRSETNFTPREYESSWTLELVQPLLAGAGRELNLIAVRQAENLARQSRWQLHRTVLTLVAEVEYSYWELALAREIVAIREAGLRLAEAQLELNRDLVETGRAVRSAVLAAAAEAESRRADLEASRGRVRTLELSLNRLLLAADAHPGLVPVPTDDPLARPLPLNPETSVATALARRPELASGRLDLDNRSLDLDARRDELAPRLDLVAAYGRTSLGHDLGAGTEHLVDDSPYDSIRVGLEIELPLSRRGDTARFERARLEHERAAAALEDLRLRIAEQVRTAVVEVDSQWPRIAATEAAVAAREEQLRIVEDRYQVGMARNLDLLEIQRLLTEARVAAATARLRYRQALAALYHAEGTLLEYRGVVLDEAALPAPHEAGGGAGF